MPQASTSADDLTAWVGRTETLDDLIAPAPVRGLLATLDHPAGAVAVGTPVPPLGHWTYFLPQHAQSETGPDGHPRRGGFLPPVALPRRMWAGGRLRWHLDNPLRVGDAARRISRIASVERKSGRSGELVFVTVAHEIANATGTCVTEEHDIVYRGAPQPGDPVPPPVAAEAGAPWQRAIVPDPVLLFRYSALTFNGHRIHYDRTYVTQEEGYPGLIVHGPLIATLLVDLVRRHAPEARVEAFRFQARRPLFDIHPFRLNGVPAPDGRSVRLWAQDHAGWLAMQAEASLA